MSPYNLTRNAVEKWQPILDEIAKNYGSVLVLDTPTPHMTAYGLREAIKAAKKLKIEPYASFDYQFSADLSNDQVTCKPKKTGPNVNSIGVLASAHNTYPEAVSSFDVVELATTHKADLMTFPSFNDDLESVRAWAESRGYEISSVRPLSLCKTGG